MWEQRAALRSALLAKASALAPAKLAKGGAHEAGEASEYVLQFIGLCYNS